eukprot:gene2737-1722_t
MCNNPKQARIGSTKTSTISTQHYSHHHTQHTDPFTYPHTYPKPSSTTMQRQAQQQAMLTQNLVIHHYNNTVGKTNLVYKPNHQLTFNKYKYKTIIKQQLNRHMQHESQQSNLHTRYTPLCKPSEITHKLCINALTATNKHQQYKCPRQHNNHLNIQVNTNVQTQINQQLQNTSVTYTIKQYQNSHYNYHLNLEGNIFTVTNISSKSSSPIQNHSLHTRKTFIAAQIIKSRVTYTSATLPSTPIVTLHTCNAQTALHSILSGNLPL